jgi:hypothetical protein
MQGGAQGREGEGRSGMEERTGSDLPVQPRIRSRTDPPPHPPLTLRPQRSAAATDKGSPRRDTTWPGPAAASRRLLRAAAIGH